MAEGSSALVNFLSDPATLATLAAVAASAAWYFSSRPSPITPPIPLDNQSIQLPVSLLPLNYSYGEPIYGVIIIALYDILEKFKAI